MLTVLAPGGAGKTRLGIQVAADLASDFPDGVFFIGLADVASSGDIVQSIAESLGVALSSDADPQDQLLAYLSNKQQLIVFDNFEHVAAGAAIISEILKAAPAVKVVATSRSKLNLTGETVLVLSGLESTWDTDDDALKASGVQLFLDAANRANPAFRLENADLEPLAEILRLTGGLPLGILLAAAWVDMLPVAEIAAEVSKSLDFLETEMGDVPDRHRSIRAVFDYSWALLSESEREMFAGLSVFKGGFTREAAQAVAGASLRNLATLSNSTPTPPSTETSWPVPRSCSSRATSPVCERRWGQTSRTLGRRGGISCRRETLAVPFRSFSVSTSSMNGKAGIGQGSTSSMRRRGASLHPETMTSPSHSGP